MIRSTMILFLVSGLLGCDSAKLTEAGDDPGRNGRSGKLECNGILVETVFVSEYRKQGTDEDEIWVRGRSLASLTPYSGDLDPATNYNYDNLQANIQIGETIRDSTATHFTIFCLFSFCHIRYSSFRTTSKR
ncbi:MAG: hypothetical protein AAF202_09690 [Pseudomonadota bacterium]